MKIIDAHVHLAQCIAGFGAEGELRACGGGKAVYASGNVINMIPPELGEYDVKAEKVLELMDRNNVEKAVLLQGNYIGFQNQISYEAMRDYPDRFAAACTYDPYCGKVEEIRKHLFEEQGFRIVKFEVSNGSGLMSYHPPVALNGSVMDECFSHANDLGLVCVMEIGRQRNCCFQVEELREEILKYPNMTFVICHLLAPQREKDEPGMIEGLKRLNLPNVWWDMAALPANQKPETYPYPTAVRYLQIAKDILGADRIMFGSDLPSTLCRDSYENLLNYALLSDVFTEEEKQDVFYNTANKIYFGK